MSEPQLYPVYFESEFLSEEKLRKIRNYFQIQRKSGGGECSLISAFSDTVYKVLFKDKQAQQRVLARCEHQLEVGGSSLVLTVRECPGSSSGPSPSGSSPSGSSKTKHELFPSSSASSLPSGGEEHEVKAEPYLLLFLKDCPPARNEFDQMLRSLQSSATLYPERETVLVRSPALFEDAEAVKTWKANVEGVLEEVKKRYVCHLECDGELRRLLLKSCDLCQEDEDVKVYSETELAIVVGSPSNVEARLKHAADSHARSRGGSLRQKHSRKRRIDEAKLRLLQNEIWQSLAKDVPDLQVTEEEGQLVLEGTVEEITKAFDIIDEKEKMVKESTVIDISKRYVSFLIKAYRSGQRLRDFLGVGESVTFEFKPTKMKILSLSAHEIEQTVKVLKERIKEEHMEVPDGLEVPVELQNLLKSMEKMLNEKGHQVSVDFSRNIIILIGHAEEVKILHGMVTKYILDQSSIEDRVVVPFPELAEKLPQFLALNGFDFSGVTFNPLQSGLVALEGPSSAVSQVRSRLVPFLQSLVKESVIVDMPGALRYSKTAAGGEKLQEAAGSHKCLIRLEDAASGGGREEEEVVARYFLKRGVQVIVHLGDITKQEADALVNAANEDLRHSGGVALALSKAAGPEVQRESSNLVKSAGKVRTGFVVETVGGKLKCKMLLHAVGPEMHKAGGRERELLKQTVDKALDLAESMNFRSIALPCISSGVFGVPIDVCAEAIVSSVRAFVAAGGRSLSKITLIDNRREVVGALRAQCDRQLRDEAGGDGQDEAGSLEPPAGGSGPGLRVEIVQGTIESQQADLLVCPMLGHQPTSTRLGQALQSVAGPALQTRFNQSSGGATLAGGSVLVDNVPGLQSKAVLFLNLMTHSSQQQERANQVLRQCIRGALATCEARGFSSAVFPVTGPGGVLQFPHGSAALALLQEIQAFEQRRAARTRLQIRIVIHPNDKEASKAFQAAQQHVHLKGFTNDANPNHASFYRHVSSVQNEVTALMGNVKIQVVQGDIIHEKTDVIVNSTGFQSSEPAGVSTAILTAAGPNVQAELKRAGKPAENMCTTGAGLLGCKEVVHVQTDRDSQAISKTCRKVLKLCESKGFTSAAFPAINTGIGQMDYGTAGKAMLDGMASAITETRPRSLSLIRVVVLQPPVFNAFKAELENRFGQVAPPQNWRGKLKSLLPKSKAPRSGLNLRRTKPLPAVFSAVGPSAAAVGAVKRALEELVQQQLDLREFELRELSRLDEMEVEAVQAKARTFGVSLDHSVRGATGGPARAEAGPEEQTVVLRGLKEDVLMVVELVNKAIQKALCEDLQEHQEQELAQAVTWMFLNQEDDWERFSLDQNYLLEKALQQKEVFLKTCLSKGNKVKVNLKALEATDCKTGETFRVKRCESDTDIDFPGHWNLMAGEDFKKVEVDPNSKEYQDIARGFHKTAKYKIHKIERVQNHHLWCSYFVMRRKMEMKNGAAELGEKYLYHGTSAESCRCIERDRFDRNYTGAHGAAYGTGVYFAINAEYSAHPRYSKPDPAGLKRMYVARVLTGRHTQGHSSMKAPPQRGADPSDKYDSLVDNLQSPSMFVIFHDDQAYPEYLITFS